MSDMGASLTSRGAYVMPSGALVLPGMSEVERRGVGRWLPSEEGQAWLREAIAERDAARRGALEALTMECALPRPTFAAVLAEARARAAATEHE